MIDTNFFSMLSKLVMSQAMTLDEKLACFYSVQYNEELKQQVDIKAIHNFNGLSGLNFWDGDILIAQLYIGLLQSDTFVIYKKTYDKSSDKLIEEYDYYNLNGQFFYSSSSLDGNCINYSSINMDSSSPYINFLYNILHNEYSQTVNSLGNTTKIKFIEKVLQKFFDNPDTPIDSNKFKRDPALLEITKEILKVENDRYLNWSERQRIFKSLKQRRQKILMAKRRAHRRNIFTYDLPVLASDIKLKGLLFKNRPISNILGTLHYWTIGRLLWFLGQIQSNLGFSIAMAIYGPFTFYFITQPMNPHAMWAVGKVRTAYIDMTDAMFGDTPASEVALKEELKDTVSTAQAATDEEQKGYWNRRMSDFKAMQIKYESAMIFSERMGRIEQFESQFNFPLTAEAAWMEMEQYNDRLNQILNNQEGLDHRVLEFAKRELKRTSELQFYIWNKLGQFFLDFPYIVVDEENEQPYKSYYVGRQFIFFEKMTERLNELGFKDSPTTHKNVANLAKLFAKSKVSGSSVLDTLKKNSKLFRQNNILDSDEHRSYMKRQWEVLFVQQNKKQEAASFALQAYTWSVKNAMWLIQTIYSAKRSELEDLKQKYNIDNPKAHLITANESLSEYYGNMFHNLVMEYVGIKKEMVTALPGDPEWKMREKVIDNIKQYLIERDKLFNIQSVATKNIESREI